jgi:hypothetical protein
MTWGDLETHGWPDSSRRPDHDHAHRRPRPATCHLPSNRLDDVGRPSRERVTDTSRP